MITDIPSGTPCDVDGYHLPNGSDPPLKALVNEPADFYPFKNRAEFEFADFMYSECQLSAGKVDKLLDLLAALYPVFPPSIADHTELYRLIDSIKQGDIPWDSFSVQYSGVQPNNDVPRPTWMDQAYEVWFRNPLHVLENQLGNVDFKGEMDYAPKRVYHRGKRRYQDLMSGNWAWEQAVSSILVL
jgi:hypothetical protein